MEGGAKRVARSFGITSLPLEDSTDAGTSTRVYDGGSEDTIVVGLVMVQEVASTFSARPPSLVMPCSFGC